MGEVHGLSVPAQVDGVAESCGSRGKRARRGQGADKAEDEVVPWWAKLICGEIYVARRAFKTFDEIYAQAGGGNR